MNTKPISFIRHALRAGIASEEIGSLAKIELWYLPPMMEPTNRDEKLAPARN